MLIGRIRGANKVYAAPANMPECQDLYTKVWTADGMQVNSSAWFPTPAEVERIKAGQPIHLHIFGQGHPVVSMSVPDDN